MSSNHSAWYVMYSVQPESTIQSLDESSPMDVDQSEIVEFWICLSSRIVACSDTI
ncbi:hypothetical protein HanRHA438_Chr13g0605031 [Helianthus annuus]|nr:hypothetical protein HanRHA438_Chr13g0605031 [Helianthus annuus]